MSRRKIITTDTPARDWNFASPDWADRLRRGLSPTDMTGRPYNKDRADKVLRILDNHRLADVPGQPFMRDACGQWFRDIAWTIAGSLMPDGRSMIKDVLIELPKKSSKTSYAGLLMHALLLASPRPRAEFLLVAPTMAIADLAYRQITGAIFADAELAQVMHCREHIRTVEHRTSGCRLSVKSFDMKVATGTRPSAVLIDECWLLQSEDASRVIGQLRGGQAAVPEGVIITISTAADRSPVGYWRSEIEKARQVRDGTISLPGYLPILWEFPHEIASDERKWSDPKNWPLVNPNLGRSVSLEWLEQSFKAAKATGHVEKLRWASQHLNIQIVGNLTASDNRWPGIHYWKAQAHPVIRGLDELVEACDVMTAGFDGGGADDLTSLAVVGRIAGSGDWIVWTRSWVYPSALELRKSIAAQLRDFEAAGDLRIQEPGVDLQEIAEILDALNATEKLAKIGLDPAGIAADLVSALEAYGIPADRIVGVKQGFGLLPAWVGMERRLAEKRMWHCDQPLLAWCVGNALKSERGLITKAASGVGKIDAIVAAACAAMLMLDDPRPFSIDSLLAPMSGSSAPVQW